MADLQVTFDTVSLNSQKQTKSQHMNPLVMGFLQNSSQNFVIHTESPPNEKGKY